jgi:hypothetical protein
MGRPVFLLGVLLGALSDLILIDPAEFAILEKLGGLAISTSMHVRFLTDEMAFRFVWRIDGQPAWSSIVVPANGAANTLSPTSRSLRDRGADWVRAGFLWRRFLESFRRGSFPRAAPHFETWITNDAHSENEFGNRLRPAA